MQGPRFGGLIWLKVQHHFASIYAEAVFLFAVNGLIITYELGDSISGTVLMITGILLSVSALIYMFAHEDPSTFPRPPIVLPALFVLVFSLAVGEVALIGSYEYVSPEVSAILFFIGGGIGAVIVRRYFKTRYPFRYVTVAPSAIPAP